MLDITRFYQRSGFPSGGMAKVLEELARAWGSESIDVTGTWHPSPDCKERITVDMASLRTIRDFKTYESILFMPDGCFAHSLLVSDTGLSTMVMYRGLPEEREEAERLLAQVEALLSLERETPKGEHCDEARSHPDNARRPKADKPSREIQGQYNASIDIIAVKIGREECLALQRLLAEDVETTRDSIVINIDVGQQTFEAHSFEELFSRSETGFQAVSNVSIKAFAFDERREVSKYVHIDLRPSSARYYISGRNKTWFLGKQQQLDMLFASLRPWYGFVRGRIEWVSPAIAAGAGIGTLLLARESYLYLPFPLILVIISAAIYLLVYTGRLMPVSAIDLVIRERKGINYNALAAWLTLAALIVSIVGTVAGFVK